jgi:hypothetical protein
MFFDQDDLHLFSAVALQVAVAGEQRCTTSCCSKARQTRPGPWPDWDSRRRRALR